MWDIRWMIGCEKWDNVGLMVLLFGRCGSEDNRDPHRYFHGVIVDGSSGNDFSSSR